MPTTLQRAARAAKRMGGQTDSCGETNSLRPISIHWFRQDLRLTGNPALSAAVATGAPLLPVYILDDGLPPRWGMGAASRWWLHHALEALDASLCEKGARLFLAKGKAEEVLPRLAKESGATTITCTRCYEPGAAVLEQTLAEFFAARNIAFRRFGGSVFLEPEQIATGDGKPYRVFTPFYNRLRERLERLPPVKPSPKTFALADFGDGERLRDWSLLPQNPDWAGGLRESWTPGEEGAKARLEDFLNAIATTYQTDRDRPDKDGTSRLSPHLHFGEISPAMCWQRVTHWNERHPEGRTGAAAFIRELAWREFSIHLLHHFPHLPEKALRPEFEGFSWAKNDTWLRAWQNGATGYPVVDAGMRQLWHTGWMHNRVRMVAASFLIKHLLIDWREGARWFWDTLVDADLANNSASWQWVAGSGADAAPFFRIFNPVLQGEKFDPGGAYVRHWVPEIAGLPDRYLHRPWEAPAAVLRDAGISLGKTYPAPIVEHAAARIRALDAFKALKAGAYGVA